MPGWFMRDVEGGRDRLKQRPTLAVQPAKGNVLITH